MAYYDRGYGDDRAGDRGAHFRGHRQPRGYGKHWHGRGRPRHYHGRADSDAEIDDRPRRGGSDGRGKGPGRGLRGAEIGLWYAARSKQRKQQEVIDLWFNWFSG